MNVTRKRPARRADYLIAAHDLVSAVDEAGGAVPLPHGCTVTVGRANSTRCWAIVASGPE